MGIRRICAGVLAASLMAAVVACGGGDDDSSATYTVGGTVTGSVGPVVLQLNGGNDLTLAAPGSFSFPTGLPSGANYAVSVNAAQNCSVANGSGTMGGGNVTNVTITCSTVVRTASLTGAQENPPTSSTAIGRGAVIVDPTTREITGGITFSGVTPTAGGHHIHQAPSGNPAGNGPIIVNLVLAPGGGVATVPGGTVLTEAQYAALLAGELYFNVHSAASPAGEIRGQINGRGGVVAGFASLRGADEVPPNASTATGRGAIVFDAATREVLIAYTTHNVTGATVAHIHTGAPGVSGPANVITLNAGTNVFTAPHPTTLSTQNVTDLSAGNTYFNVHSGTFPNGEIRGQIAVQASGGSGLQPTLASIQDNVFTPQCATSGCHGGGNAAAGLRLDAGFSHAGLVNVASPQGANLVRVVPGDPGASLLIHKLEGTQSTGSRMPLGGPFLPQSTIDVVRRWITDGAQP